MIFDPLEQWEPNPLLPRATESVQNVLLRGGKQVRPQLVQIVARGLGVSGDSVRACARAAEWLHAATLAHDDVIDEATTRRGRASVNEQVGNKRAILAGDLLLSRVIHELAATGNLAIVRSMASTAEKLVTGEWLQLDALFRLDVDRALLDTIAEHKTGALLAWCAAAPARLAECEDDVVSAFEVFGRSLGLAFQIVDDALDYSHASGKEFAKDLRGGLVNRATLRLFEIEPAFKASLVARFAAEDTGPLDVAIAPAILTRVDSECRAIAATYAANAKRALASVRSLLTAEVYRALDLLVDRLAAREI